MNYTVYVDGSFKGNTPIGPVYAGAACIFEDGVSKPIATLSKASNDEIITMRNVAGEIIGVMLAMEHFMNVLHVKQTDHVTVNYDYEGIEKWVTGEWRAKNRSTQGYRDYINLLVRPRCQVSFKHIKAHTGNYGNEMADKIAKAAIDNYIEAYLNGGSTSD